MSLQEDIAQLKAGFRKIKKLHHKIRLSLDDGDAAEYDLLEEIEPYEKQILELLNRMGKEYLTNEELHARIPNVKQEIVTQQTKKEEIS